MFFWEDKKHCRAKDFNNLCYFWSNGLLIKLVDLPLCLTSVWETVQYVHQLLMCLRFYSLTAHKKDVGGSTFGFLKVAHKQVATAGIDFNNCKNIQFAFFSLSPITVFLSTLIMVHTFNNMFFWFPFILSMCLSLAFTFLGFVTDALCLFGGTLSTIGLNTFDNTLGKATNFSYEVSKGHIIHSQSRLVPYVNSIIDYNLFN